MQHIMGETENFAIYLLTDLLETVKKIDFEFVSSKMQLPEGLVLLDSNDACKDVCNIIKDVIVHLKDFGMYGGRLAVIAHLIQLERIKLHCTDLKLLSCIQATLTILQIIKSRFEAKMNDYSPAEQFTKFSSDKVKTLIYTLKIFKIESKKELFGIIFVQRRFTAKVLYHILMKLKESDVNFSYINPDFVVGFANNPNNLTREGSYLSKMNRKVLDGFNGKEINLLIASNVIEEGVDVPKCTFVCKFDFPTDYRSYIQSKGRARDKESYYYIMVEDTQCKDFAVKYQSFLQIESILNKVQKQFHTYLFLLLGIFLFSC